MVNRFIKMIYLHYKVPKGIINDRNPLFTSKFWSKLCNITETKYKLLIVNKWLNRAG